MFWKTKNNLIFSMLILIPWLVFGRAVIFDFVWDDVLIHIIENPYFNPPSFKNLIHFWIQPYRNLYIPVAYTAWGLVMMVTEFDFFHFSDPVLFHFINILFHTINGFLVFGLLKMFTKDQWAAAAGAVLFLIHPVQVESVVWVSELRGVLSASFGFTALYLYCKKPLYPYALYSWLCFTCAVLTKPSAVVFIIFALLSDLYLFKTSILQIARRLFFWAIPALGVTLITSSAQVSSNAGPIWAKLLVWIDATVFYLGKIIMPLFLAPSYARTPEFVLGLWWIQYLWIIPVLILVLYWLFLRDKPAIVMAGLFFIVGFLPVSGLITFLFQQWSTTADRYLYLSMFGVSYGLSLIFKTYNQKAVKGVIVLLLLFLAGWSAVVQVPVWKNNLSLWTHCIRIVPNVPQAYSNRGMVHKDNKQYDQALADFNRAIQIKPDYTQAYLNRGNLYKDNKQYAKALMDFNRAITLDPKRAASYIDRGATFVYLISYQNALKDLTTAITLNPSYAKAYNNRGFVYRDLNQDSKALDDFNQAIGLDPSYALSYYNRGHIYAKRKAYSRALADLKKAQVLGKTVNPALIHLLEKLTEGKHN